MYQLLSGLYIGASCFWVGRLLRGGPDPSTPVLALVTTVIASAFAGTVLAKPAKNDHRPASAAAGGVDGDTGGETRADDPKSL
jgi:hypothetical protein